MDYQHLAILMLFVGLAFVIAEIFVPSGGMISILAAVSVGISIWAAYKAWWSSSPGMWWSYLAALVLLLPATIGGALFLLQRTSLGRRILLEAPSLEEVTPYLDEEQRLKSLIGKRGKTITLLNPGGMVLVEGQRLHCECEGMLIDPGEEVEVVSVKGNRLVVRLAKGPPSPRAAEEQPDEDDQPNAESPEKYASESESTDEPPLDFEVPQS